MPASESTQLRSPILYIASQRLLGADRLRRICLREFLKLREHERVLDIGCGPGYILDYMPHVDYIGFDTDPRHIEYASRRYRDRGRFFCVQFEREHLEKLGPFDAVMLFGLLHHLDDNLAGSLLGLLAEGLAPGGRMATIDPCLTPDQSYIARWVALSDRGRFVRGEMAYRQLVSEQFAVVEIKVLNNVCRAAAFYRRYLGDAGRGNLFYQNTRGAGHSLVVNQQAGRDLNACPANQSPYIDQCGYDQAGIILQHIYGALRPGTLGPLSGTIKSFDQNKYTGRDIADALSMGDEGYVFVPSECEQGAACRVHVALHGCKQDAGTLGRLFVEQTGYNAWADANRIIVLYPQTKASPFLPFNPEGCWDWWSYIDHGDDYVTKAGRQIAAIKAMLDALTAGGGAPPAPPSDRGDAAAELIVTDTSDTAAALAWTAVTGASSYRIWRAGADGIFQAVAETVGLSHADHGLAPATPYAWRVTARIGGVERSPSPSARATTRPTPAACGTPGRCP